MSGTAIDFSKYEDQEPQASGPIDFSKYSANADNVEKKQQPSTLDKVVSTAKDVGTGITEGAANTVGSTVAGTSKLLNKIPYVGQYLAPKEGIKSLESRTTDVSTPQNTAQSVGKTGEQIAEWLIPSGAEEKAGVLAGKYLPQLGKAIPAAARIITGAGESGLRNLTQGGEFKSGAAIGGVGSAVGEGLKAAAPALAETAMGIAKRQRGYGKTPGVAILEDTRGIRPETIEKSAQSKIGNLTSDINNAAASHTGTVSLQPAIDRIDNEINKAIGHNDATTVEQLSSIRDQLTKQIPSGTPIPADVSAERALALKRGVRNQFVSNWNPEVMRGTRSIAAGASGDIDRVLDSALGQDFASNNQRISSLIPVAERAESLTRDPGIGQKIAHRMSAHTGALASAGVGAGIGYHKAGTPGAIAGGIAGAAIPELLSSPTTKMLIARSANSGIPVAAGKGAAAQLTPRHSKNGKNKEDDDEE